MDSDPTRESDITKEELQAFHTVDRKLYARLVLLLGFDTIMAFRVMGLWLWMEEELGYQSIILYLFQSPEELVRAFFEEAVIILGYIQSPFPPNFPAAFTGHVIPRTFEFMKEEISLDFFHVNQDYVLDKIVKVVTQVCMFALEDAIQEALDRMNMRDDIRCGKKPVEPPRKTGGWFERPFPECPREVWPGPFSIPQPFSPPPPPEHFGHPMPFPGHYPFPAGPFPPPDAGFGGHFEVGESSNHAGFGPHFEVGESSNRCCLSPRMYENFPLPTDNRTMFMTFSRGYPITEQELYNYFLRSYGDVIEEMQFEVTQDENQPLYAIVVFRSPAIVERILNGRERVKFVIRGKHVWTRRFIPKR